MSGSAGALDRGLAGGGFFEDSGVLVVLVTQACLGDFLAASAGEFGPQGLSLVELREEVGEQAVLDVDGGGLRDVDVVKDTDFIEVTRSSHVDLVDEFGATVKPDDMLAAMWRGAKLFGTCVVSDLGGGVIETGRELRDGGCSEATARGRDRCGREVFQTGGFARELSRARFLDVTHDIAVHFIDEVALSLEFEYDAMQ